jgi:3-deoxy-D-manno-octulosonic-acid transferase
MFFNILFFIYALIYFPYLMLTGRWYKDYGCRLGFFPHPLTLRLRSSSSIWIHAVSVGEVNAVTPLIARIKASKPNERIVLTVTTKTGYELACQKFGQELIVIPSPLDFTWVVSFFVKTLKPKLYIAAETEIWPNLYDCLHKNNVPIVIINGRISDVSYGRYKAIKFMLEGVLRKVSLFSMQSDIDATRIVDLGAPRERVFNVGNIKFDDVSVAPDKEIALPIPTNLLRWIAGSTHPGEEEILLNTLLLYKSACVLVIAPRHVERAEQIMVLIKSKGLKAVRLSQLTTGPIDSDTVIVVDTIGQLKALYAKASFVFIGKSLCVGGGQNIIEPALYAKPIIVGPMMENFRDITALFKAHEAIIQIEHTDHMKEQFAVQVGRLIKDEKLRTHMGQKALDVVKRNQGALSRTLTHVEKFL